MANLQDQLDAITSRTRDLVQPDRLAISEAAVAELHASGAEQRVLSAGAPAPEFSLRDAAMRQVRSADLLALGPLIINFFRGRWCPYCITELESWRDHYARVRERGALLVAISPQTPRQNAFTAEQHRLPFPVLSDPGCKVSAQFGLAYTLTPAQQQYYRSILVNIPFMNGDESWTLPLPATSVVNPGGRLVFVEAHADFRVRPEPSDVLETLASLTRSLSDSALRSAKP